MQPSKSQDTTGLDVAVRFASVSHEARIRSLLREIEGHLSFAGTMFADKWHKTADHKKACRFIEDWSTKIFRELRDESFKSPTLSSVLSTVISLAFHDPRKAAEYNLHKKCVAMERLIRHTQRSQSNDGELLHQFRVHEFRPGRQVSQNTKTIKALADALTIDLNKHEPQEGFGRFITHEEIRNMISSPNVRTYILSLQSRAIGFYVLDIEHQEAKIVGVSKEGREIARNLEVDAYGLLDEAMMDTACAFGITHLTGEVREGLQANTAKSKHLIRGWKETETVKVHDGHPYRKLERDVMATLPHPSTNPSAEITIASSAELHPVYKDVIRKPLAGYLYILGLPVEKLPEDLQNDPTLWSNCTKLLHEHLTGLLVNQDIPEDEKHIAQLALTHYEERARAYANHIEKLASHGRDSAEFAEADNHLNLTTDRTKNFLEMVFTKWEWQIPH